MKNFLLLSLLLTCALGVAAQTRPRYVFDNFSSGKINVESPAKPAPSATTKNPAKKLVKKTVQSEASLNAGLKNSGKGKAQLASNRSLNGFTTGDDEIDGFILDSCARYGVDPLLIYAQMNQESSFKLRATSYKGARGLMQLMPATAARFGVTNIYDPQQNIEGGVKYMRWLLNTFNGDISLALAGYNAGENAVMKYGWAIPPYNETQNYVARISARYQSLRGGSALVSLAAKPYPTPVKTYPVPAPIPVEEKKPGSINIDERAVYAVKTRDGKTQLVTQ
ncbi:MAG TPA: lytic transglycosylase domain-containing protein [Pyrinomonadaceae bacterium]|jgi:hypothetical protein|nr:lytic transglycosylase domain-containing protein [Pyrinomonadaceae bacterium]